MSIDRRRFLGTLVAAPAALACSGASAVKGPAGARDAASAEPVRGAPAKGAAPSPALAAVRAFTLTGTAEPAFTFRASPLRAGEP